MIPAAKRSSTLLKVFVDYDAAGAKAIAALNPPCQKGCSACCYEVVDALPVEAELIRNWAAANSRKVDLRDRLLLWQGAAMKARQFAPSPNPDDYFKAHLACPLLDQTSGACLAYEVRPMACRAHVVDRDAGDCAKPSAERKHQKVMFLEPLREAEWTLRAAGAIEPTANLAWLLTR